jgi:hypothetical protein
MRYFTCCGPECRGEICRHATAVQNRDLFLGKLACFSVGRQRFISTTMVKGRRILVQTIRPSFAIFVPE